MDYGLTKNGGVLDSFVVSPQALIGHEGEARLIFHAQVLKKGGGRVGRWIRHVGLINHHINSLQPNAIQMMQHN